MLRPRNVTESCRFQWAASSSSAASTDSHAASSRAVDLLGEVADPGGRVHRVADHGVLEPRLVTDIAGDRLAGRDADAGVEVRNLVGQASGHRATGGKGTRRVILELDRSAEDREYGVADELVDQPGVAVDLLDHDGEEPVQQLDHLGRLALGREGGGSDDVHEQHRDLAGLATELHVTERCRLGDVMADVPTEEVAQLLPVAEPGHHLVEPGLELAELGAVVHLHLDVELALLHLLHGVAYGDDRRDDRTGVEPRDQQTEAEHHSTEHEDHYGQLGPRDVVASSATGSPPRRARPPVRRCRVPRTATSVVVRRARGRAAAPRRTAPWRRRAGARTR